MNLSLSNPVSLLQLHTPKARETERSGLQRALFYMMLYNRKAAK